MAFINRTLLLSSLLILSLVCGCAHNVTEKVPFGSRMIVDVNFGGALDLLNNKYFMVLGQDSDYQLPMPPDYEFVEPGLPVKNTQINYFDFYSTWAGYVVVDGGIVYLYKGPFPASAEGYVRPQPVQIGQIGPGSSKIEFNFIIEQVFGPDPPNTISFDFVSAGHLKYLVDHLTPPSRSILRYSSMLVTGSDEGETGIDPSLNILNWSVMVQ
jgi:hypothetical protein